ncbi:hypothetical protein Tco_0073339 [Tanacetum coccineum]
MTISFSLSRYDLIADDISVGVVDDVDLVESPNVVIVDLGSNVIIMERGFLSQKGGVGGRGVKEKQQRSTNIAEKDMVVVSSPAAMEVESPSVVEETVEKEKLSPVVNTSNMGSYPPLPTQETSSAGNALGKSSYANVTGKPSGKKFNIHTLFTPRGNGIDVVVSVESIRAISD